MDVFSAALLFPLLVGLAWTDSDPCFTFNGNGYLRFNILNFVNNDHAHYSLKFTTYAPHGLILYAESGTNVDDEALYVRDGRLTYHLFNSSPTGVEGDFGGLFQGDMAVNTGAEIEVDIYRAFNVTDTVQRTTRQQTGLVYKVGGRTYTHVDHRPRSGITLTSDVYIGGFKSKLSDTVGNFSGQIYGIREEKNQAVFSTFSINHLGRVSSGCSGLPDHQPV